VTLEMAEALVKAVDYYLVPRTTLMHCTLILENGFAVSGKSACLPTTEFSPQLGMKFSREDATRNLMELLAFQANDMVTNGAAHAAIFKAIDVLKENPECLKQQ